MGALLVCLWFAFPAWSDADKERKKAAKSLAQEIERAQFHKVYVPDFLDASGTRTEQGCYFASAYSTLLSKDPHGFEVVNRIQAQKQLDALRISSQDLVKPELLSKAAQALGADAVLVGTATISPKDASLLFSLRNSSGKEVHSMSFHEKLEPAFDTSFPAIEDAGIHFYYFPGLDGVSQPRCRYCPNPDYTDEARLNRLEGNVLMSVALDEKGAITNVRVMKSPYQDFVPRSLEVLKKWRLEPSRDAEGHAVPVRVMLEITFRLLN